LGDAVITQDELESDYSDAMAQIRGSLSEDADLLIYGCNFGEGDTGEDAVTTLSELTGADVAASDDLTGAADKGGDWDLELNVGTVETQSLEARSFTGILMDTDGDGIDDFDDIDDDNDGILDELESPTDFMRFRSLLGLGGNQTGASGSVDVSADFGLEAGSLIVDYNNVNTVGNGNFTVMTDNSPTFTLSGSVWAKIRVEHGSTLTNGAYDGLISLDGTPYVQTAALESGYSVSNTPPLYSVAADGTADGNNGTRFVWDSVGPASGVEIVTTHSPTGDSIYRVAISVFGDKDQDMIHNNQDLDSDNDGISDLYESGSANGIAADTNFDGTISSAEALTWLQANVDSTITDADADDDGLLDLFDADITNTTVAASIGTVPVDTDGDGIGDHCDLDSDNDGIPDVVEAQSTDGYVAPTGMDSDGDGIDDAYDSTPGFGGGVNPVDTDGDGMADYVDTDSDNDGMLDIDESGITLSGMDANGDGIDDALNASYSDPDGDINDPENNLENGTDNDTSDVDYRSVNDSDGDGVPDHLDLDDDNDGVLDSVESQPCGPDSIHGGYSATVYDGVPGQNSFDLVSNATTFPNVAGFTPLAFIYLYRW